MSPSPDLFGLTAAALVDNVLRGSRRLEPAS
jgi:hypothetical protein